ncbi:capsule-associated protein CAP1 [Histoplasma capsulatum]|uniref:Capsule-associated protein CAP1 n=1 Tax=Ajellomyces capsulatus TaxID=5037 RepID=A0A8A1MFD9_AJECA|nr:capsule-associated protein CAP1 [Histoplasma capsulatum]
MLVPRLARLTPKVVPVRKINHVDVVINHVQLGWALSPSQLRLGQRQDPGHVCHPVHSSPPLAPSRKNAEKSIISSSRKLTLFLESILSRAPVHRRHRPSFSAHRPACLLKNAIAIQLNAAAFCVMHVRTGMRTQRLVVLLAIVCLVVLSLTLLGHPAAAVKSGNKGKILTNNRFEPGPRPLQHQQQQNSPHERPTTADDFTGPSHPIAELFDDANRKFDDVRARQSKTLKDAVEEYRRRYKLPPPPNFDVWFDFAQKRDVQLIDEFDTIYHSLLPFWGLQPKLIRARAMEVIGFDNGVIAILIRDGKVSKITGGDEGETWKRNALQNMLEPFVKYLPDLDLAFNVHDEPRVVVPHDDLQRLVVRALDNALPKALRNASPKNSWSPRPKDMNKGDRVDEVRITQFNRYAHQPTWIVSRMSCPVDSPARYLDGTAADNITSYTYSKLGFLSNSTAFSDICLSPSLQYTFGFFDRPNAFNVVHDLFPIFSQSKVSSFQDIIYPSPWYWAQKVPYDAAKDIEWDKKKEQMYWRGSTTGGFSRAGSWRRQHRQLFVKKINGQDSAKVLERSTTPSGKNAWVLKDVARQKFKDIFNVKFSHIGQCDPEDCKVQAEFFDVVEPASQHDAWNYKHLLDIDGNAFSGRYYAFMQSNSLVYKLALFREWHDERLRAWVHYVPLSLRGDEHVEAVRYLAMEKEGQAIAQKLANQGKEWANSVLRNDDLEVYFFRLLLEYGRIVDDNRESIGFSP